MHYLQYFTKDPIRLALALSLVIHLAALWKTPALRPPLDPESLRSPPLTVQLAPRPRPAPRAQPAVRPPPPQVAAAPARVPEQPRVRAPARPPVMARRDPAPAIVPAPRPEAAPSPNVPPGTDLASYIEARRRERGEPAPSAPPVPAVAAPPAPAPPEDPNVRANRIAAANLGLNEKGKFGPERKSGGVFDLTYLAYDYAEFAFYGWNSDIQRNTTQKIAVRKGDNPDIRLAVVRRMIVIIREYEKEDFSWQSHRLNRNVTLSARQRDTAGLEAFLISEFFEDPSRPRSAR